MPRTKRRIVEIYFILYLAALVFILPDGLEEEGEGEGAAENPEFQIPFSLHPVKTTLTARMIKDSSGVKIVSIDSVNTIFYTGKARDLKFEFIVEDKSLSQKLRIFSDKRSSTKHFKIIENRQQQSASFYWTPPLNETVNKTLIVKVIATAKSGGDDFGSGDGKFASLSNRNLKAQTQFSLNVNFINQGAGIPDEIQRLISTYMSADSLMKSRELTADRALLEPNGDFQLEAQYSDLKTIAYQKWRNQITVYGGDLSSDLREAPKLNIINSDPDNGGSAEIEKIENNVIYIAGITPAFGETNVEIALVRKYDSREYMTSFRISPQTIEHPQYSKTMYPEVAYVIDPKMPLVHGQQTKAYLRDDSRKIRASSPEGQKFSFTPDGSDVGKTFYLERYVDNNLLEQTYPIKILDYPAPVILRVSRIDDDEARIQTRSIGKADGKKNWVARLEFKGNAKARDIVGLGRQDEKNLIWEQVFEVKPQTSGKPFTFSVRAVDSRGGKSAWKKYP